MGIIDRYPTYKGGKVTEDFAGSTDMWSTSAGGHLMKVVNLTGFTVLVSSANKIGRALCSMALDKSLMYTENNSGPKIEPCGTPYFILVHFEIVFEIK